MKITLLETAGFSSAIKAMRLPMKSGDKSDSHFCYTTWDNDRYTQACCADCPHFDYGANHDGELEGECTCDEDFPVFVIGENDYELSAKLIKAGSSHRKHLRLIDAWLEIEAPLYWWKEFDTYRVGVDKLSESTMHTFKKNELLPEDFDIDESYLDIDTVSNYLDFLERHRKTDDIQDLQGLIPQGYKQKRVVKASYEALRAIYGDRRTHKLKEWREFCEFIENELPYSEFITHPSGPTTEKMLWG